MHTGKSFKVHLKSQAKLSISHSTKSANIWALIELFNDSEGFEKKNEALNILREIYQLKSL